MKRIVASQHALTDLPRRGFPIAEAAIYMSVTPWYVGDYVLEAGRVGSRKPARTLRQESRSAQRTRVRIQEGSHQCSLRSSYSRRKGLDESKRRGGSSS